MSTIDLLNTQTDVASGQHMPAGEMLWAEQVVDLADDEEEIVKEALGLTSIPSSTTGGEILDFQGVPENPGLSREQGDGEAIDFFGAAIPLDLENDVPPGNLSKEKFELSRDSEYCQDFENLIANFELLNRNKEVLKLKSVIKFANDIKIFSFNDGEFMKKELEKLESQLRSRGKVQQAAQISGLQKKAQERNWMGAGLGAGVGAPAGFFSSLIPGVGVIPMPIRVLMGGTMGAALGDYFLSNLGAKTELQKQSQVVASLEKQLLSYGATQQELSLLSNGTLPPDALASTMKERGVRVSTAWSTEITKLAGQYVQAVGKLSETFKRAQKHLVDLNPEQWESQQEPGESQQPISDNQTAPSQTPARQTQPVASPARVGSIADPSLGRGYSYDPHSSGGYVVVTAPPGKESSIGAVLKPGTEGYNRIKAFVDSSQKTPEEIAAKDNFRKAEDLVREAKKLSDLQKFLEAADFYQKAYDLAPRGDILFNVGKAYFDGGDISKAVDVFKKYREAYPEDFQKNLNLVPKAIREMLDKTFISDQELPQQLPAQYQPTRENIQNALKSFLRGATIQTQTPEGTATTLDSDRLRRLTQKYMRGISEMSDPDQALEFVSSGIADKFGPQIQEKMLKEIEAGSDAKKLGYYFNGLIWNALRRNWAEYSDAAMRKGPTEQSQRRRHKKLERQDRADVRKVQRSIEQQQRRDRARTASRQRLITELHKVAAPKQEPVIQSLELLKQKRSQKK